MGAAFQFIGLVVLCAACPQAVPAQLIRESGRSAAMGGQVALRTLHGSVFNPASAAGTDRVAFLLHTARPYHGTGLAYASFASTFPVRRQVLSVAVDRLGYDDFGELAGRLSIARAWHVAPRAAISAGARLRAVHQAPTGHAARRAARLDAGWIANLDTVFAVGASIEGMATSDASGWDRALTLGVAARAKMLTLAFRVRRAERFPPSIAAGLETVLNGALSLRGGITSEPLQLCGGVGLKVGAALVDLAAVSHAVLGLSSSVSLTLFP